MKEKDAARFLEVLKKDEMMVVQIKEEKNKDTIIRIAADNDIPVTEQDVCPLFLSQPVGAVHRGAAARRL